MQTFLPYPDIKQSASVLDYRRLGKQRVEAMQIYNILTNKTSKAGWRNHPAVLMWHGCESFLAVYHDAMITEWIDRGYRNTMKLLSTKDQEVCIPKWFGNKEFHASHRSNLLRKDLEYYSKFGWKEDQNLPYVWPV